MTKKTTLLLRCCKADFAALSSWETTSRYLEAKPYWESRILNPDGTFKSFTQVEIKNGYKSDSPTLLFDFLGFWEKSEYDGVQSYEVKLGKIL